MKILYELSLKIKGGIKNIFFGIPNNENELKKMFLLREEVYIKNNYINAKSDKDEYDNNGKCVYFIAKIDDDIIGTVRFILDNPLPTRGDCFDFEEPSEMAGTSKDKMGELSRLISIPYKENIFLPRHLVLIFLMSCVFKYSEENGILGGYSFITSKLYGKMKKINVPFYIIKEFSQKYPADGLMYPYFNQKDNPILPIYFKSNDVKKYFENLFNNRKMFERIGDNKFKLQDNLYNKFLHLLKII